MSARRATVSHDCPQHSPDGVDCGVIGPHTWHAGVDEHGHLVTWVEGQP